MAPLFSEAGQSAPVGMANAKFAELVPTNEVAAVLITSGPWPVFVSVAVCDALVTPVGLVKLGREEVRVPEMVGVPVPVPERLMEEGELLALLSSTMLPV